MLCYVIYQIYTLLISGHSKRWQAYILVSSWLTLLWETSSRTKPFRVNFIEKPIEVVCCIVCHTTEFQRSVSIIWTAWSKKLGMPAYSSLVAFRLKNINRCLSITTSWALRWLLRPCMGKFVKMRGALLQKRTIQ